MIYDVIVIGGGVTGAGTARDAAMRGLKTLLLEKGRPGRQTTAASSRLIHGGLRYLLYDRLTTHTTCWDSGHIARIARPLLNRLPILWPVYDWHTRGLETVETLLEIYDGFQKMKGGLPHERLSAAEALGVIPGLKPEGLLGALAFDEWQVDPVKLVEKNLDSARRHGAQIKTNEAVTALELTGRRLLGVRAGSSSYQGRIVINAAGPWIDKVSALTGVRIPLRLQKGTHLVYKGKLAEAGLLLEAAGGGRYVFILPGPEETLVGPTDLPGPEDPDRTTTDGSEIKYLADSTKLYLPNFPENYDRTIVGSRPILGQAGSEKLLSREYEVFDHEMRDSLAGFITIGGGKMSDFRVMAEAAVNLACLKLGVARSCSTFKETLDGQPVGDIPYFPRPFRPVKKFLRKHPRLREIHAWIYLAAAFLRHMARRRFAPIARPARPRQ